MPASAIPVVAAVVAFFACFIAMVGGAAFWSARPASARPRGGATDERGHDL
jgi:predicted small integral membrane protein